MSKPGDKGGDSKGDEEEEEEEDSRLELMCNYVLLSLRLKPDRWQKMILVKESEELVMNFLDNSEIKLLVIMLTSAGVLQPTLEFPSVVKPKAVYFYRKEDEPITKDNLQTVLGFGDLTSKPVDELGVLINQMFIPLLTNPKNQTGWPGSVAKDVMEHAHQLKNSIYEIQGKAQGKTLLPLPMAVDRLDSVEQEIIDSKGEKIDLFVKADIEGIISRWALQINKVLAENSSCAFERETNPTPRFEIDFWDRRCQNLSSLYDQFHDPRVKKMASILQLTGSANFYCFKSTFDSVVNGLAEARDICVYLTPLVKHLDKLEALDFKDVGPLLRPFIHCIALLWCHCRNYCNAERIVTLLREVSNLMIEQCSKYLDPSAVFQGDPDETLIHVRICLSLFDQFRDIFETYRENLISYFPENAEPVLWTFHTRAVFQRMLNFVDRLKHIENILATAEEYLKLEKVEIGGTKGRVLSGKVYKVFDAFQKVYAAFNAITYDCLDPEETGFKKDHDIYFKHIEDLDCTLAAVFGQAMDDCSNLENIYKLRYVGTTLLDRPIMKEILLPKYQYMIPMMTEELATCKLIYDDQMNYYKANGKMMLDKNFPPVAGALMWIHELSQRITIPFEHVKILDLDLVSTPDFLYEISKYDEMKQLLQQLQEAIFDEWTNQVPDICQRNLAKTLINQAADNMALSLNFDPELVELLHEVHYMTVMEITGIPDDAVNLYSRNETLVLWIQNLNRIIEWYNIVRLESKPVEFNLAQDELHIIDDLLKNMIENLNWNTEDNWDYISEVRQLVESLYTRMTDTQKNVEEITTVINSWKDDPLFQRKGGKRDQLLDWESRSQRIQTRYSEIRKVAAKIADLVTENFKKFFNIVEPEELEDLSEEEEEGDEEEEEEEEEETLGPRGSEQLVLLDDDDDDDEGGDQPPPPGEAQPSNEAAGKEKPKEEAKAKPEKKAKKAEAAAEDVEGEGEEEGEGDTESGYEEDEMELPLEGEYPSESEEGEGEIEEGEESTEPPEGTEETEELEETEGTEEGMATTETTKETAEDEEDEEEAEDEEEEGEEGEEVDETIEQLEGIEDLEEADEALEKVSEMLEKKEGEGEHAAEAAAAPAAAAEEPEIEVTLEEEYGLNDDQVMNWFAYLEYIDNIIVDGLSKAIEVSLQYLLNEMNPELRPLPFLEASLELHETEIAFNPSMEMTNYRCFYRNMDGLIFDIFRMSYFIPRVAKHLNIPNYKRDMMDLDRLSSKKEDILRKVRGMHNKASEYSQEYEKYSYLWLENRQLFLNQFLTYGHTLTDEETEIMIAASENPELPGLKETPPTLAQFKEQIDHYQDVYDEVDKIEEEKIFDLWFRINVMPFKQALLNTVCKWMNLFKQHLVDHVVNSLNELENFIIEANAGLQKPVEAGDYDALLAVMEYLFRVREHMEYVDTMFEPLHDIIELLKPYGVTFAEQVLIQMQELPEKWEGTKKIAVTVKQAISPLVAKEIDLINKQVAYFDLRQKQYRTKFLKSPLFQYDCPNVYEEMDKTSNMIAALEAEMNTFKDQAQVFEITVQEFASLALCRKELKMLKRIWDFGHVIQSNIETWKTTAWKKLDVEGMEMECKKMGRELRGLDKAMRKWDVYIKLAALIKNLLTSLRAVTELQNPSIKPRHWQQLMAAIKMTFTMDDKTTLADLLALRLHEYEDEVKFIVEKSIKEMAMEKVLKDVNAYWSEANFDLEVHPRTGLQILRANEEMIETLEDNQVALQSMMSSKYVGYFLKEVSDWQQKLSNADQVIDVWFDVQRTWSHLESIFIGSEDIRKQLPEDTARFAIIDSDFKGLLSSMVKTLNVVKATNMPNVFEKLEDLQKQLTVCEKALSEYLETKRLAFPRFYFISSADLLDILSNGNQPELVAKHLCKLYDSMSKLKFEEGSKNAIAMWAKDGEFVNFKDKCDCTGAVETWLSKLTDTMRDTIREYISQAIVSYEEHPRDKWIFLFAAQVVLVGTQIWWSTEVNLSFARLEEGYENAIKDYNRKQISQLNALIVLLLGDLTAEERQKIMTVCTIDVHSRDVVGKLILQRIDNSAAFQWQSQLRHRWDEKLNDCYGNICDAQFMYAHEYLGCTPRLVITPLTDRCYITLTQSLRLIMGGAPAGPAGTGKTETTKDLGRALGVMVYVFNCSEQMDYKSCEAIYKGLAQTGAWGCFDEFNRISVEVLSVVAVQVKTVLDAIKARKTRFNYFGYIIDLCSTVGLFITMNPGYAGRTELPENLKALFRPCAMVVPDFELICEIMLVAEGFQLARLLAHKFITLYSLCKELLSKQDHYDWGLRAIKSVLVVAGSLRRADRARPEDQVLMRALRDFNVPKIVTDDMSVFMGLIGDLFPALNVPRKRNMEFEKMVKQAAIDIQMQPEDNFILKVVQLQELLDVRHSVFIVGNAGTGKTMVWKTLFRTYQNQKRKPVFNDLNPKAVINNELFGFINPSTREWKDGLLPILFRDQANLTGDGPKWIVLDGDIDPMWIESLNTVMDDNKVLTLASNERIALTKMMRLLFEIYTLRVATPATVSRAGILYVNPADLGWNPYVLSWIETRPTEAEKALLTVLFDKYVPSCLEVLRTKVKKITPIPEIGHLEMLCFLLESLLIPANVPAECPKEWYEIYFVFSAVWAFGSTLYQDQIVDHRVEFTKWWVSEFKTVKFPSDGTVFSYYIDPESKKFVPWSNMVKTFELDYDIPLQATLVPTSDTTCIRYLMDLLMDKMIPVMLVGTSGTGKSVIVQAKLNNLPDSFAVTNVPFNFYTTSAMLQRVLEMPLEKKAGRNYGPKGNKTMIYFVDDMNMPEVDMYYTVQPHALLRQYLDYGHWYDRVKMQLRDIHNCQFVSCMNPTAGSFTINPRLQRHFCVFAVNFPTGESLFHIYHELLSQHLRNPLLKMNPAVAKVSTTLVNAALDLHQKTAQQFLPTAVKFHYIFNLRDLSNIFQAMLYSTAECVPNTTSLVRLWMHEAHRVYGDKLVDKSDIDMFEKVLVDYVKKAGFEDLDDELLMHKPLIYCHFAEGIGEGKYMPIKDWTQIKKLLAEAQSQYNDLVAAMNLVMFEDAIYHVCRINRIIEGPRGNALLVGVGGSGKQSLSRLSAFLSSLEVFQIQLRRGYGVVDMTTDLAGLYVKAGMKSIGIMFLMADSQVGDERFLVLVNDMLASGEVPDMFADDDVENMMNNLKNEVKSTGVEDTKENCWQFFINRVRHQLKIVLCFSPVGSTLRVRARKFPSIISCTAIDWFHEWPQEALVSVSANFLEEIEDLPPEYRASASKFMAFVHTSVNDMSKIYLENEKRYNYTTPKTFLEQINLYSKLLKEKTEDLKHRIFRLENGLEKLKTTAAQVDDLKVTLKDQEKEVNEKNEAADQLIKVIGVETEKVSKEKAVAADEERKVRVIEEDVTIKQKVCEEDLRKAEPALVAAQEALNTLNKNNLTELKSFGSPPDAVVNVTAAVLVLFSASQPRIPKDRSWKECKIMMGKVDEFLNNLINYDKEHIPPAVVRETKTYVSEPQFDPELIMAKSKAAAGLCAWVINIMKFYDVYLVVEPKRKALEQANAELKAAQDSLSELNEKVKSLEEQLGGLTAEFQKATKAKLKCQQDADRTTFTIDLANRLVGGLASESVRWKGLIGEYNQQLVTLPGDILMVTAFVSYVGCFTLTYRADLLKKKWMPFFADLDPPIPMQPDLNPMDMLTHDAQIAEWQNEGLPSDRMSAENATILIHSERWPLMIDPQLQGLKWIKNKYGSDLKVIRLTHKNYLDKIEYAISDGNVVLLENIMETVDAVLDPLLSRNLIKKGRIIKIGDREVDYNHNFRLIIQTKLANPHFKPEMQAQTTLINFTVTRVGLEEQLLAEVVKAETPDLDRQRSELTKQQNDFKINLKRLEDDLLNRLAAAGANILSDVDLVLNLEKTKNTADEIEVKVAEAKVTSVKITEACEIYRPAARRSSLLYFILSDLYKINPLYQFSLKAFSVVFNNAIDRAPQADKVTDRVNNLIDSITFMVFMYTSRGLFEKDKLIFLSQMTFQVLQTRGEIEPIELDFLLRFPFTPNVTSPVDFLTNNSWGGIKALSQIMEFQGLDKAIEGASKRWKKFVESEYPEKERFPQEWKNKTPLEKLCMMRALRPDRMTYAMKGFVEQYMGKRFIEARAIEFSKSYEEMSPITPIFFVLSPGVDPLKDVEKLGKKLGFTADRRNLHNVSLGQGQEIVAENAMIISARMGHWVILQNIHLVATWLPSLEKRMEKCWEHPHKNYRLFISAEPAPTREAHIIPQGILESSIKITNEPPTGMLANLHSALDNFNQETLEMCSKEAEFKAILFVLCYFHAAVAERRKFGPQGWNRRYPFNIGDLTISVSVLYNYLEVATNVPWEDLRYLFGEIMYGGHITDDWDRRLCRTYLEAWMKDELLDGAVFLAPGFQSPPNLDYVGYHQYIDSELPDETPYLYGLHPNAEIGFLTSSSQTLFHTVFEMQPRDTGGKGGAGISKEEKVKGALEDILDRVPEPFNIHGLMSTVENKTPYVIVALQECERMNILMNEIRRSLVELSLGLKGELTITADMEALDKCLFMDEVPPEWTKRAYPSLLTLGPWFADLMMRMNELEKWASDFVLPATVWLAGFFNPQSFLTAIMQQTARKNEWPLDKMCLHCDVTRKQREDFTAAPREGAYIHGLFMEGARWDESAGHITEARLKELYPVMPVLYIKAITQDKLETKHMYECPVYKTRIRGPTFVWTFNLRTKAEAAKWTMAGVAILLSI